MSSFVEKVSVSLTKYDQMIVKDLAQRKGLRAFSAALRMIIREWVELTNSKYQDGSQDKDQ